MISERIRSSARHLWREWVKPALVVLVIMGSFRSAIADWNDVPTGSMKPTILEGDRVCVNRLAYDLKVPFTTRHLAEWGDPRRGEIVVFFSPHDERRLVKRVVGAPGDTIELANNRLLVNGRPADYAPLADEIRNEIPPAQRRRHEFASETVGDVKHAVMSTPGKLAPRNFGPVTVPPGHYFMMGDNRDDSFDSRFWGCVERRRIVGRATAVALSVDRDHFYLPRWHRFFTALN